MVRDWSRYILPVGGIVLLYYVLKSWGIIDTCDPMCTQCSKGSSYSKWIGQCDVNYTPCGLLHESCCCDCCMSLAEMGWEPIPEYQLVYLRELVDSL